MNHFHIGISTNLFHNPKDIVSTISPLSQKFPVIELELEHGARDLLNADHNETEITIKQLNKLRESRNIEISVHAPYIGGDCDLIAEDEQVRQISCNLLHQVIELSARFEAKCITYHPGYVCSLPTEYMIENLKRSLDQLIPKAASLGIDLCLENTGAERPSYQLFSPHQYVTLSQQTGTFITLDLIHHASLFSQHGKLSDEFFVTLKQMLPYVKNVHFADMEIPKHNHLPIGQGNLPVLQLLEFLKDCNYQGNAIIEETGGGFTIDEFWSAACDFYDLYAEKTVPSKSDLTCILSSQAMV